MQNVNNTVPFTSAIDSVKLRFEEEDNVTSNSENHDNEDSNEGEERSWVNGLTNLQFIMLCVAIVLFIFFVYKIRNCVRYDSTYHERIQQQQQNQQLQDEESNISSVKNKPQQLNVEKRYELIEASLMSMLVVDVDLDNCCDSEKRSIDIGKDYNITSFNDLNDNHIDVENDVMKERSTGKSSNFQKECSICLEQYKFGDIVSMTAIQDSKCCHIFHNKCIKEWLLQHDSCPSCRFVVLGSTRKSIVLNDTLHSAVRPTNTRVIDQTTGSFDAHSPISQLVYSIQSGGMKKILNPKIIQREIITQASNELDAL